ncbi:MAG: YhcH/YjgK/YiaL family protein [Flavisolibacter sp.]
MKKFTLLFLLFIICKVLPAQEKDAQYYLDRAPFKMQAPVLPQFADRSYNIRDYGAVPDGHTLNTVAFANAIDACNKSGGGRVVVPAGLWLTGPIEMKSNVNLVVERGAIIQFTPDRKQYPIIQLAGSSSWIVAAPIYGSKLKNIAITGEGIIDGAGESWRPVKKSKVTASQWKQLIKTGVVSEKGDIWWPSQEAMDGEDYLETLKNKKDLKPEDYLPARDYMRPYMVHISSSENILVEGVTIRNAPKFIFYPTNCTNLTIRFANFFNEWWAQNGDAIDISACKNVLIYKCNVSAGDDGICMKSSNEKVPGEARLENVVVAGCTVYHGHGGFVIGSNTDGGMNNIYVADCNFIGTDIGIRVKSNTGRGGTVKNIFIEDIFMHDIIDDAIHFDTYYEDVPAGTERPSGPRVVQDKTPDFHDFHIKNVVCRGADRAIFMRGLPEQFIRDIQLENLVISSKEGYVLENAKDIHFKNVELILPGAKPLHLADTRSSASSAMEILQKLKFKPHMSIDTAEFFRQYYANQVLWDQTFDYLNTHDLSKLAPGDYPVVGQEAVVKVSYGPGKEEADAKWESHKNFIDLQYVAEGQEKIGVAPVSSAKETVPYNKKNDVTNYEADGSYYVAKPDTYFLFFPTDAHRPGIKVNRKNIRKVVVKIRAAK